jgi:RNA polymerase sigma factor (sigma-70 family)
MTDDTQLLQEYAMGSEQDFRELVERYVNLVYSAAIRHLEEAQLAQDVAQTVFTALARKARTLPRDVILGGWLYRHTCFVASQAARTERRRRARDRQALEMNALNDQPEPDWERLSPFLDQAMQGLGTSDRDAVVLRYFEGRNLRNVGAALGISEEAARKRVTRALERLRSFFARRGVTLSATALAALLAENVVVAAPAGMAGAVSAAALTSAVAGTGSTLTLLKLIVMTKIKIGIVGAIVVAAVVTPLVLQHQSRAKLREADESARQQAAQLANTQAENDRLASLAAQAGSAQAQSNELLRLRARAATLGSGTNELPKLRKENRRLQATQDRPTVGPTAEQQQAVETRMNYGKSAIMACMMQTRTNQGLFPSDFGQVTASLPEQMKSEADPTGDAFELLYHGAFKTITTMSNPQDIIVIRQKQPTQYGNRWAKVYVCADGHCEVHTQADNDFAAWESQHAIPQPSGGQ